MNHVSWQSYHCPRKRSWRIPWTRSMDAMGGLWPPIAGPSGCYAEETTRHPPFCFHHFVCLRTSQSVTR
ncbi:hypothetical protein E2C01_059711 [Portunus trituberculatus]|uniref:Uncharacterized protein n=1 Tax=Portunus trituberculatus TaxID=210409 RepID=A0A5B7H639_PORTR|nr:hypothetical protein [Portunus trituberculatus]